MHGGLFRETQVIRLQMVPAVDLPVLDRSTARVIQRSGQDGVRAIPTAVGVEVRERKIRHFQRGVHISEILRIELEGAREHSTPVQSCGCREVGCAGRSGDPAATDVDLVQLVTEGLLRGEVLEFHGTVDHQHTVGGVLVRHELLPQQADVVGEHHEHIAGRGFQVSVCAVTDRGAV